MGNKWKHTKGPWTYRIPCDVEIESFPYITVSNHQGGTRKNFKSICHIEYLKHNPRKIADAMLLAAATEMKDCLIEECKKSIGIAKSLFKEVEKFNLNDWKKFNTAKVNVIEKATGQKIEDLL